MFIKFVDHLKVLAILGLLHFVSFCVKLYLRGKKMDDVQKQAVKDLLHEIVDKEEIPVIQDLLGKLPAPYAPAAQAIIAALGPVAIAAEDKVIDSI